MPEKKEKIILMWSDILVRSTNVFMKPLLLLVNMRCIIVVFCDLKHGDLPCFKSQNTTMIHFILTNHIIGAMT